MENTKNIQIADLHCHILPGMDDGASDEEEALEMIRMEYDGGIREIALTSHFNCEKMELRRFLERRMRSFERLTLALKKVLLRIERYPYIMENLPFLYGLAEREINFQMNEGVFLKGWMKAAGYYKMLRCGLVQLVASDAHSVKKRSPNLSETLVKIKRRAGCGTVRELCRTSHLVFNGKMPEIRLSYNSMQSIVRRNK